MAEDDTQQTIGNVMADSVPQRALSVIQPPFPTAVDPTSQHMSALPALAEIDASVAHTPENEPWLEALAIVSARNIEREVAREIAANGFAGESWWPELAPSTKVAKARKGQPLIPLVATGATVNALKSGTLPVKTSWHGDTLEVSFGFSSQASEKGTSSRAPEQDLFTGGQNLGRDRQNTIPSRYPRLTPRIQHTLAQAVGEFMQQTAQSPVAANPLSIEED